MSSARLAYYLSYHPHFDKSEAREAGTAMRVPPMPIIYNPLVMPSLSPPADAMYPASHRYGRMEPPQMPRPIAAGTITDAHARKGGGRRTRKDETKTKTQKKNKKQESMEAIASSFTGG